MDYVHKKIEKKIFLFCKRKKNMKMTSVGNNLNSSSLNMFSSALTNKNSNGTIKVKLKKTDNILYPEFYHAMNFTEDYYWKEILYNCSIKKLPRGFVYADQNLRFLEKEIYIKMPTDIQEFCNTAIYFFQKYGNKYSTNDKLQLKKKNEEKILESLNKKTELWSNVSKSLPRRSAYVQEYVERVYGQYPKNIRDELFTQINLAFTTGYITKSHILMDFRLIII
jgi:hypothetical protein